MKTAIIVEGVINMVLSIAFVLWFEITGVIVATLITNLLICHIVEPYVLYKHALHVPVRKFYIKNYLFIAMFVVVLALHFCMLEFDN